MNIENGTMKSSEGLTPSEAASRFNVPVSTIKRWLQDNLIEHESTGEGRGLRYKVGATDLAAFLQTEHAGKYRNSTEGEPDAGMLSPSELSAEQSQSVTDVELEYVLMDSDCQVRAHLDQSVVKDYAVGMSEGVVFPPVELFHDEALDRYFIGDGYHRVSAAKMAGRDTIKANINTGGKTAAIRCALHANATHGLRRTSADKRRAIQIALREYPHLSNVEIAKVCAVSESSVRNHRDAASNAEKRIGADGKRQVAKKRKPSAYKRAKSAITRVRCTAEDAEKLIEWLMAHYKLKEAKV